MFSEWVSRVSAPNLFWYVCFLSAASLVPGANFVFLREPPFASVASRRQLRCTRRQLRCLIFPPVASGASLREREAAFWAGHRVFGTGGGAVDTRAVAPFWRSYKRGVGGGAEGDLREECEVRIKVNVARGQSPHLRW